MWLGDCTSNGGIPCLPFNRFNLESFMARRLIGTLVVAVVAAVAPSPARGPEPRAQGASRRSRPGIAAPRIGPRNGEWGVAIGTMDGRILWSMSPELALIPASTAKVFTTGFTRARVGGDSRITTRVVGDGALEPTSGRWQGTWALELGGDWTLDRTGRSGPTLRELARRLRARGVRQLEGPLALTSRTGPASEPLSRASGPPTSRDSSTHRRSARSRCTRTPSRSPTGPAATPAHRRSSSAPIPTASTGWSGWRRPR